jgi:hypothetical protein
MNGHFPLFRTVLSVWLAAMLCAAASAAAADGYTITLDGGAATPTLTVGAPYTLQGIIRKGGAPAANETFGVHDGLRQMSYMFTTDAQGRFALPATPRAAQAAYVEFLAGQAVIARFAFNVVGQRAKTGSVWLRDLRLVNDAGQPVKVTVQGPPGNPLLEYVIQPGKEVSVVRAKTGPAFTFQPTGMTGTQIPLEALGTGGSVDITIDANGVGKLKVTAGALGLLRFSIYGTRNFDAGLCWSPGGELIPGVGVGASLCVGTDGISVGGSISGGIVVGGASIKIVKWQ